MKKVAIVGLRIGLAGNAVGAIFTARGYQVVGSKTRPDGVEAARMSGIECYQLNLTPLPEADQDDLAALFQADALIITLPASRTVEGANNYFLAFQQVVDSALAAAVPRIIFTSSTSVYGEGPGVKREESPTAPCSPACMCLVELENWLHQLAHTSVDILHLAGLVGPGRHTRGASLAGKQGLPGGGQGVNLVSLADVITAITLLIQRPRSGHRYNLCAPGHPAKRDYYPAMARALGVASPVYLAESGAGEGKIIDGSRICKELGFAYLCPDPAFMPLT
ncbi:NAD-dependent epimerase/dehydratase family protein [Sodalis-like symbiont of Bactericera trigonica]|nr:NAD-dependent epimerase/dehydratase family protein [Sodalis-like symbiont of Bactericera trigonica]